MTVGAENPEFTKSTKSWQISTIFEWPPHKKTPGGVLSNTGARACRQVSYSPGIADFSRNRRVLAS